jgi:hypothetical protein
VARDIFNGSTGNRVRVLILDDAGIGKAGVAHNAASLVIGYRIDTGSAVTITLTSGNWFEVGGGNYLADVADSVYASGNLGKLVTFYGSLPSSTVVAEQHRVTAANYGAVAYGANTTTPPTTATIADTTLSSLTSGPSTGGSWPNGSFGRRVLVGSSTQREVAVTGSHHVAADVHEFQPDAIDSDAIATSAITEIAGGVWSAASSAYSAATGTMGLIMYAFSQMLENVSGWRWKEKALEQAPTGGGNNVVNVLPAVGISAERQAGVVLSPFVGETITQSITLYATDGTTPINLSGKSLEIVFQTRSGTDVAVIANANITVSGTSSNIVTFAYPSAATSLERTLRVSLRDNAAPRTVYLSGLCKVSIAPSVDA